MTALPVPPHPILACVTDMREALDRVAEAQPVYLSAAEKAGVLRDLATLGARVSALQFRVMAVADDVAEAEGARDVAAWFAHHTLTEPGDARSDHRLAVALDQDHPQVAEALAAGRCSAAQARVIVQCMQDLPARIGAETLQSAEATLVGYAADFPPRVLRRLGRRILDVVAPEVADAEDARRLEAEERAAREHTRLSLRPLGDGTTRVTGRLPDATASRLRTYLEAFTTPRTQGPVAPVDRVPFPRRLGQGFCALLEHLDPKQLPHHGGDATTVIVTITLDQLRAELATADILDTDPGTPISAGEVRRLACTARVVPAVLGGTSEILDLGRAQRLYSSAQRKAMRLRDRALPRPGLHDPGDLVRSPPPHPLGPGRAHRPGPRSPALSAAPPGP